MPEHCCTSPFPAHIQISPELNDKGEALEASVSVMGPRGNVQGGKLLSQERSFLTIRGGAGAPILSKNTKSINSFGDKSAKPNHLHFQMHHFSILYIFLRRTHISHNGETSSGKDLFHTQPSQLGLESALKLLNILDISCLQPALACLIPSPSVWKCHHPEKFVLLCHLSLC